MQIAAVKEYEWQNLNLRLSGISLNLTSYHSLNRKLFLRQRAAQKVRLTNDTVNFICLADRRQY